MPVSEMPGPLLVDTAVVHPGYHKQTGKILRLRKPARLVGDRLVILDRGLRRDHRITPAMPQDQLAATLLKRAEISADDLTRLGWVLGRHPHPPCLR